MPRKKVSKSRNPAGRPSIYGQRKTSIAVSLSPDGVEQLDAIAESLGLSRSEFIERIARGVYLVTPATTPTLDEADAEEMGKPLAS